MKVEFISNLNRQYMAVAKRDGSVLKEGYVSRMILENEIPGILPASRAGIDGQEILCYDITGKISVFSYLSARAAEEGYFLELLNGIANLQRSLQRYLISRTFIMALPEQIFFDPEKKQFLFGIWPYANNDHIRHMQKLSEFLISGLATGDRNAAQMVYGFYQACISGEISETEIRKITGNHGRAAKDEPDLPAAGENDYVIAAENSEDIPPEKRKEKTGKSQAGRIRNQTQSPPKKGRLGKMTEWLSTDLFVLKKKKRKKEDDKNEAFFESLIRQQTAAPARAEPEAPGTVFLQEEDPDYAFALVPDNHEGRIIPLIHDVNTVGRVKEKCDIVISDATVSRIHAKLIRNRGSFDVIDTGSKNGTKVNGRIIPKEVPFRLSDSDFVAFAGTGFRFKRMGAPEQERNRRY